jgi:methionyl-tRNA synthetase
VPVPDDEDQIMYVWCDNLTSYISSLGYFTDHEQREWWDDATVTHVIGKDIARFHALNWPAMLSTAGVKTPDQLFIHGFITCEGQKMSKSLGNVVAPGEVADKYGVDALRFYLLHEVPVGGDGDFTWEHFASVYNAMLRNQLGNLLNRVMVLLRKDDGTLAGTFESPMKLGGAVAPHQALYAQKMDSFEVHLALQAVMKIVDTGNQMMQQHQPWSKDHTLKRARRCSRSSPSCSATSRCSCCRSCRRRRRRSAPSWACPMRRR